MMRALKEYNEMVMRPSLKWLKKHWKGYSVFVAVISMIGGFGSDLWYCRSHITEYIRTKFKNHEEES